MYLEKLEIQGFKSFASKNLLKFPGMIDKTRRGLTAVVGPNGSGKSNVADAVRWVLGEQSMKTLRGKKSEDVIFSGSDKKGQLGMAEVSMHLNNEDRQAPVDFSEIVITRRLYRDGESEYMVNNSRARLSDIQMLLAKSKFGQKTYSVIGQGMVEGFLNTSLAERKEFFDEATGVKQYQIKRDESLGKLRASYENLIQAQMLTAEIEPRLKSLTRQVSRLKKRGEIEHSLRERQTAYYRGLWHETSRKFAEHNSEFLALEKARLDKEKKLSGLNRQLEKIERQGGENRELTRLREELAALQKEKAEQSARLARLEAQTEIRLEASGQADLSFFLGRRSDLENETRQIEAEIREQEEKIKVSKDSAGELERSLAAIEKKTKGLNQQLRGAGKDSENLGALHRRLSQVAGKLGHARGHEDMAALKAAIREIEAEVAELLLLAESLGLRREDAANLGEIQAALEKAALEKDEVLGRVRENDLRISARSERARLLGEKLSGIREELLRIGEKMDRQAKTADLAAIEKGQAEIKGKLQALAASERETAGKIGVLAAEDEAARRSLFGLQRELSQAQQEANAIAGSLNEIKVAAAREETRLEALEAEIRAELGGLKDIKDGPGEEPPDREALKGEIGALKRQLDLIGGIDPEVESEYNSTKERYDFLFAQISDFSQAVASLKKIIKELDLNIKDQFDREFKLIADNFEKYFKTLFNGGQAKIHKVMEDAALAEDEPAEDGDGEEAKPADMSLSDLRSIKFLQKHNATGLAGIEIQATPPGKKIKSVAMLSGGERALTAIALICAIISSNPSPFVVLDEVDAALDEANSERLAKILDELSHKTQFIVITHNRASMRRANILYGVTMGDDGVSKLLSVKLDEAVKAVE